MSEEVLDDSASMVVCANVLGSERFGVEQRRDCIPDVAPLGMSSGEIDEEACPSLDRESGWINALGYV